MRFEDLDGKRVAVWGLGREGGAFLNLWQSRFPGRPLAVLSDSPLNLEAIPHASSLRCITGSAIRDALGTFDVVVKSPGISMYRPEIAEALAQGVRVSSPTALWFAEHQNDLVIAVTGTKGKSTTSSLIAHLLQWLGHSTILAGNIGIPLLERFTSDRSGAYWVVELSSYQICGLEHFPRIAVLLNLYAEHSDWHGSVERYFEDKLGLFRGQGEHDRSVVNRADPRSLACGVPWRNPSWFNAPDAIHARDGFFYDGPRRLFATSACPLPGAHNHSNVCAALTVLKMLEIDPAQAEDALAAFRGLPHRLELVGVKDGVRYVDDSISTIPEAALSALHAFAGEPVTLLCGGYERAQDWQSFARKILASSVCAVITMPDNGARIAEAIRREQQQSHKNVLVREAADLEAAVAQAAEITPRGGVILLSPAAPSYGRFSNFEERGAAFRSAAGL